MTKVMTVVGTRPEIIRLSETIKLLDSTVDHVLVHTGQNYDHNLNEIFFSELGLRAPDHYLDVDTSSLGRVLGEVLIKTEEVLLEERPDAVLVLGDTNSCLAAVMAKRMRIPVYHMEAGNRCFDENVPEETNRRLVDHVADFNLVYTEHARRNLLAEGLHPRRILKTGSPMKEVLAANAAKIEASDAVERLGLTPQGYVLVSAHREENVDNPDRLNLLLDCLESVVADTGMPVLVSTHPRTRKRLDALGRSTGGITFHEPLGFMDYNKLQKQAYCVLSDSGTISEESSLLDFPAVTLRDSIERPEALDSASILMTGLDSTNVVEAVRFAVSDTDRASRVPDDYRIGDCSRRAVGFILSTHARYESWLGIRP
ncbi:non-hydrolyzing UDP-N-acetylglucosamine 2-epimerase [Nocardioides hwasunensis]|uniref:UDP-N-acetylglucosamine 2-epimerase (Non-hydrolyzing) n=1 Tax=Nocardioides hwasunensis TaxID=397258 RepID=A0ABR8MKT9_9ACTN|nr:UDP-N-acetylglucosamine 2-epimerase (non-hydrolyzing) [Nocardioides hwasunensis]MBD3916644.1 UDP-N-acetylglucosamine 2-epimerase (non-hydrolyzing) [Nocardioides hwasunensis]